MLEITDNINDKCKELGIMIDTSHNPIKVGPDVYMFYGVPSTSSCTKHGHCEQLTYYALTGKYVSIIHEGRVII